MSLRLYGVIMHDGQTPPKLPAGTQSIPARELAAVVEEGDHDAREVGSTEIERYHGVISQLFALDAVLPAPVGTVFRSTEVLQRWMELHYVALSDALAWVENRLGARVHVTRATARDSGRESGSDLTAIAVEVTRSLRRHAVASVPLRHEEVTGLVRSAAFLVERELWEEFADAVEDERLRHPLITLELSGPWPPYDFVQLQFGD